MKRARSVLGFERADWKVLDGEGVVDGLAVGQLISIEVKNADPEDKSKGERDAEHGVATIAGDLGLIAYVLLQPNHLGSLP